MRVIVRPSFLLYTAAVYVFSSWQTCLGMLLALTVHEVGHCAALAALREPIDRVELTPFGGVITYRAGYTPAKGIRGAAVAVSGPAANYLTLCLLGVPSIQRIADAALLRQIAGANLSMMLLNLLPVLPLDGGSLLFSVGYYLFDVSALVTVLCLLGAAAGIFLFALGIYGYVYAGVLNLTLPAVGAYLASAALQSRGRMLMQNLYTVLQERLSPRSSAAEVSMYLLPANGYCHDAIRLMAKSRAAVFLVEYENGDIAFVDEKTFCRGLLEDYQVRFAELAAKRQKE